MMGQNSSTTRNPNSRVSGIFSIPYTTECLHVVENEFKRVYEVVRDLSSITHEELQQSLRDLNELCKKAHSTNGTQIVFAISRGTDDAFLWKATIRIAYVKVNPETKEIIETHLMNLKDYLFVLKMFEQNIKKLKEVQNPGENTDLNMLGQEVFEDAIREYLLRKSCQNATKNMTSSDITFTKNSEEETECPICLDRRPDLVLDCSHAFCTPCIEQWNSENQTCPYCQGPLQSTDDAWVIPDMIEMDAEINAELKRQIT